MKSPAPKEYPLDIENVGEDTYLLISRGHHNFEVFMGAVAISRPGWSMGKPSHEWWKAVPTRREGYRCIYAECMPESRGAFPVTVTREAYGEDRWDPNG